MKAGLAADRGRGARPAPPRSRPGRRPAPPVGGRGGVRWQRRAAVPPRRAPGRRLRDPRAVPRLRLGLQVGVLWFHVDVEGIPAHVGEARRGGQRDRGGDPDRRRRCAGWRPSSTRTRRRRSTSSSIRSTSTSASSGAATGRRRSPPSARSACRLALFPGQQVALAAGARRGRGRTAAATHPYLAAHPPACATTASPAPGSSWPRTSRWCRSSPRAHEAVTGAAPERVATTATTDARAFVELGIPAVCLGPLAERIHGVDERVHLPSMVTTGTGAGARRARLVWGDRVRIRTGVALAGAVAAAGAAASRLRRSRDAPRHDDPAPPAAPPAELEEPRASGRASRIRPSRGRRRTRAVAAASEPPPASDATTRSLQERPPPAAGRGRRRLDPGGLERRRLLGGSADRARLDRPGAAAAGRRRAAGHLRDSAVLPHERDAGVVRLGHRVQPARDRPLGEELRVRQLLRLVRRSPPERARAHAQLAACVRLDRGDLQLPPRPQGGRSTASSPVAARPSS